MTSKFQSLLANDFHTSLVSSHYDYSSDFPIAEISSKINIWSCEEDVQS